MNDLAAAVLDVIAPEIATPAAPAVHAVADAARARHGDAIVAVLFYGSCLRTREVAGKLVDLYLLADDYARVHRSWAMRLLNRLVPPNVYYVETTHEGATVRAKYALVTLDQLERLVSPATSNPYFWARFAQPTGLLWAKDAAVAARVHEALARAVLTLVEAARPMIAGTPTPMGLWEQAFALTYRTELRAEPPGRAAELVGSYADRHERLGRLLLAGLPSPSAEDLARAARRWRHRRRAGKLWSVARLVKAAFTFQGGADYLAWKIERHSGVKVEVRPWHRRHPVLASLVLFAGLYRKGAFR